MDGKKLNELYQIFYETEHDEQMKEVLKSEISSLDELSDDSKMRIMRIVRLLLTEQMTYLVSIERQKCSYQENNERNILFLQ